MSAPEPTGDALAALPLAGIKVLDLGSVVFAPYAGQWLADLGADVVKVEAPGGCSTRYTGPSHEPGMSAIFLGVNRSKRSIVLDLGDPSAREALLRLVDGADVLLHSIRPQKLAKLGLDPDTLLARNPRLVFAGLHGFADGGPYAGKPAYDDVIQGMTGIADLMGRQSGSPAYYPAINADKVSGLTAAIAILAALVRRNATGKGGFVEVPMFESVVAFNLVEHLYGEQFVPARGAMGYPRAMAAWRRPLPTADGFICTMPYTDAHWRAFFTEVGRPDLAVDARFTDVGVRTTNIGALYALAGEFIATRTTADWVATLGRLQIPAAPMATLEDLLTDPQLAATNFFEEMPDPAGTLRYPGVPVRFDGVRPPMRYPPRLGEHTRTVLAEAGFADADIDALVASRAAREQA